MNKRRLIGLGIAGAAVAAGVVLGVGPGGPASPTHAQSRPTYMYTVKFACVPEVGPAEIAGSDVPFVPAMYRTAINVHNPQRGKVAFLKHALIARSEEQPRGKISQKRRDVLLPDEALDIDCLTVQSLLGGPQPVGDGFVVIESPQQLDVVAVYTSSTSGMSAAGQPGQGADVEVEYIQPRTVSTTGAGTAGSDAAVQQSGD